MFKTKKVRPLFTGIITTANKYVGDSVMESGILDVTRMDGDLNEFQTVVAVGDMVKDVAPGDIVHLNFKRYMKAQHVPGGVSADNVTVDKMTAVLEIPMVYVDGKQCLFVQNNDIEYVVEEFEGVSEGGLLQ